MSRVCGVDFEANKSLWWKGFVEEVPYVLSRELIELWHNELLRPQVRTRMFQFLAV